MRDLTILVRVRLRIQDLTSSTKYKYRYILGSLILLFVSDELDGVVLKMMIAKLFRDSKKTISPSFRGLVFATTTFSQKTRKLNDDSYH